MIRASPLKCDQWLVEIDRKDVIEYSNDFSNSYLPALGCHEAGHTLGLEHWPVNDETLKMSCMRAQLTNSSAQADGLHADDKTLVNLVAQSL